MKLTNISSIFLAGWALSCGVYAAPPAATPVTTPAATANTLVQQTQLIDTKKDQLIVEQAKLFGLTKEDWLRYEELIKGPQRFQNANTDPVMVLGSFARNEAERAKYAELAVRNMHNYMSGVLAFQRAYQAAQTRLFGHMSMLYDDKNKRAEPLKPFSGGLRAGDRVVFFTKVFQCDDCKAQLQKIIGLVQNQKGMGADIYFMDTGRVDSVAQKYAADNGVPVQWVQSKVVTLNHENGELFRLDGTRAAPTAILHRGTEYYDFQLP